MASKEAQKTIDAMQSAQWQNKVAPRALLEMIRYKPGQVAHKIKVPALLCVGAFDRETIGEPTKQLATGPHAELREYPVAHFDFYRPGIREKVLKIRRHSLRLRYYPKEAPWAAPRKSKIL